MLPATDYGRIAMDPPSGRSDEVSTGRAGIATITLDSQHNRNALSRQLSPSSASDSTRRVDRGRSCIVLPHEGPTFCAGADLKERAEPAARLDADGRASWSG